MTGLQVQDLTVSLTESGLPIASGVSFDIAPGEVLGLVGESGSGKSTVALALLGFARAGARITGGQVVVDGQDVLAMNAARLREARSRLVAYVPQDPSVSLNPAMRIGKQLVESLTVRDDAPAKADLEARLQEILSAVELPHSPEFLRRYPHELSGGQQQRVAIAMAALPHPRVLVFDEPTTGLDVSTQARVLELVGRLCAEQQIAAVYVSHDLSVVAKVAQRILVLYAGRVVEYGTRLDVFTAPKHPYTQGLLESVPGTDERRRLIPIPGRAPNVSTRPTGCVFAPRCVHARPECTTAQPPLLEVGGLHSVACIRWKAVDRSAHASERLAPGNVGAGDAEGVLTVESLRAKHGSLEVLHGVDLTVRHGECLALVGESGSGKSTLSRCLIGLHENWTGEVRLDGVSLARSAGGRDATARRRIQYVFQNPYSSLNPRRTVGASVAVPLGLFLGLKGRTALTRVHEALDRVGLPRGMADRYPQELSGGERQRAAIARALVCEPRVLLCDEVTSALDVSVQATVVELLRDLMTDGLSMLFVTHNLAVVRSLADRIAVLNGGSIVELADADTVFSAPTADYTRSLIVNTPAPPASELAPAPLP